MGKLSVVISAYNEENKIGDCLLSASFADEIVFVDNSSTDKTVEKAEKFTSKIFKRPNLPMLNTNKNFGFSKVNSDWIFCLDADERISQELASEIKSVIKERHNSISGLWVPRKNMIFGKWMQHTGWYPDYQLRLFKKGKGKFEEKHVHEMIKVWGETEKLKGHLIHLNFETISQFLHKHINIYSDNEVKNLLEGDYCFNYLDAIRFPLKEFLSRFFAREGYKDGFYGLMLSFFMAFYHFVIFAKVWEKERFKDDVNEDFLIKTEKEFKKSYRELMFWFLDEKTKTTKNTFKRFWLKIQKRFL